MHFEQPKPEVGAPLEKDGATQVILIRSLKLVNLARTTHFGIFWDGSQPPQWTLLGRLCQQSMD